MGALDVGAGDEFAATRTGDGRGSVGGVVFDFEVVVVQWSSLLMIVDWEHCSSRGGQAPFFAEDAEKTSQSPSFSVAPIGIIAVNVYGGL